MAVIAKPFISDLKLEIDKDTANANVKVDFKINWSEFDKLTNLPYDEKWELVGDDNGVSTTIFVGPSLVSGVSSNGNATTQRTKTATIAWADLNEDPSNLDEIAALVTMTPKLPVAKSTKSALVVVDAP